MSKVSKLKSLSEFEWASVAQYMIYIASVAHLAEVNNDHVISFPLARIGPERLLRRKQKVLAVLELNTGNIERFVGSHSDDLEDGELSVLRTMYMQYRNGAVIVREHIRVVELYEKPEPDVFARAGGSEPDEPLF